MVNKYEIGSMVAIILLETFSPPKWQKKEEEDYQEYTQFLLFVTNLPISPTILVLEY